MGIRVTQEQRLFKRPTRMVQMMLEGPDQPGLLRAFTRTLTNFDADIRDLDTDTSGAPFAGYAVFSLKAIVAMPVSVSVLQIFTLLI